MLMVVDHNVGGGLMLMVVVLVGKAAHTPWGPFSAQHAQRGLCRAALLACPCLTVLGPGGRHASLLV